MANNVTLPAAFSTDPDIFQAELIAYIEAMDIHDLDASNFSAVTGVITVGPSSPGTVDGSMWWDTNQVTNGPSRHLKIYNSAISGFMGAPSLYVPTASLPAGASATPGMLAYDTTLQIMRVYRTATEDMLISGGTGVTGWHPIESGYQLWTAGATVVAGDVVVRDPTGQRKFKLPTAVLDPSVVGVALEGITSGATGIIALVSSQRQVTVNAEASTHAIAAGDYLACNAASSGAARSRGAEFTSAYVSQAVRKNGTPLGCFATAVSALATGTATLTAQFLGFVGGGCRVLRSQGAPTNASISQSNNGTTTNESSIVNQLLDTKHNPTIAALVGIQYEAPAGSVTTISLLAGGTAAKSISWVNPINRVIVECEYIVPTIDNNSVPTGLGILFQHRVVITSGGGTASSIVSVGGYDI